MFIFNFIGEYFGADGKMLKNYICFLIAGNDH